jgi:ribonuclease Z
MYKIWEHTQFLKDLGVPVHLQGDALSADASGFWIQEWKVMLDAGLESPESISPEHIFITHMHTDHIQKLPFILQNSSSKPTIYVPFGTKEYIENYLIAFKQVSRLNRKRKDFNGVVVEVCPGDVIPIIISKCEFEIKVFETDHLCLNVETSSGYVKTVSVGYAFSKFEKKLQDQYKELPPKSLVDLKKSGIEITEIMKKDLLIYTGDTMNTIFSDSSFINWGNYKIIITESTFIKALPSRKKCKDGDDIDIDKLAYKKKHNVLEHLEITAKLYPNTQFLLCHWSLRYEKKDIKKYFETQNYSNIFCWINES